LRRWGRHLRCRPLVFSKAGAVPPALRGAKGRRRMKFPDRSRTVGLSRQRVARIVADG
jgi:hypothetical protein